MKKVNNFKKVGVFLFALGFCFLLSCFSLSGEALAKSKEINYQKEFSKYLQWVVADQGIDKNKDGRLSSKEVNAVRSLVLNNPEENEYNVYSLAKISVFKNLQELRVNCTVKSLTPLNSLKRLTKLEFEYYGHVDVKKTNFSKIENLKTLIVSNETFGGIVDLRKNKKLRILEGPAGINEAVKYYLPDCITRLSNINPACSVYFGNKRTKAVLFYKAGTVTRKQNIQEDISYLNELYVVKNKTYTIKNLDLVSATNEKSISKVLKGKNIQWKCSNKNAKINNGNVQFKKSGWYTLFGYVKNRRYIINLQVVEEDLKKLSQSYNEVVIFGAEGKTVKISEYSAVADLCSRINNAKYKVTSSSVHSDNPTQESFQVVFKNAEGKWLRTLEINEKGLTELGVSYKSDGNTNVFSYLRDIFVNG